ncbi:restriction endonuclease subunit S [Zobellia barbeyronii]|uniref:Restriction endonuclease subunit S n=1 Tax=Zobellia barbeyronii TaxID=2748009 RepID=A0ABS5WGJ8_9FLAO|nr:restriction endonuclease subunit S [Zobellia barbeyronii]MBT2161317.1 restriction endonuclease subunit S [Zobellia barbeyronii]
MEKTLPKNWVETNVSEYLINYDNQRKPISSKERESRKGDFPYFGATGKIDNIDGFTHDGEFVLIGEDGANLLTRVKPLAFLVEGKIWVNNHAHVLSYGNTIQNKLFTFYFNSLDISEFVSGSAQPKLNQKNLGLIPIKLPPLAEQHRIVAKLDELFGYLDTLKIRLNNIPQILKNFRQAVLTQAVTGKLTEEWRVGKELNTKKDYDQIQKLKSDLLKKGKLKKNKLEPIKNEELIYDLCPEFWHKCIFDDLFRFIDYRGKTPQKTPKGLRLITAKNIKMGFLSNEPIEFMSEEAYEDWMTRGFPIKSDIFFVTEGYTMGNVALNNRDDKFALAQRTLTLQSFSNLKTTFFYYLMMESRFQLIVDNNATGTAAKGIKAAKFKNLPLIFPSLKEQTEIVKRVEHLFAKADAIEAQYQSLKVKIDSLPQAILAKAFKGELVEQLDTDGDAKVLLEEIKKLKVEIGTKRKTKK